MRRIWLWGLITLGAAILIQQENIKFTYQPSADPLRQQIRVRISQIPGGGQMGPVTIGQTPGQIAPPPLPEEKFNSCRDDGKKSKDPKVAVNCGCEMACAREILGPDSFAAQHDPKCATSCRAGNCGCTKKSCL